MGVTAASFIIEGDTGANLSDSLYGMAFGCTENDNARMKRARDKAIQEMPNLLANVEDLEDFHRTFKPFLNSRVINADRCQLLSLVVPFESSHRKKIVELAKTVLAGCFTERFDNRETFKVVSILHPKRLVKIHKIAAAIIIIEAESTNTQRRTLLMNLRNKTVRELEELWSKIFSDDFNAKHLFARNSNDGVLCLQGERLFDDYDQRLDIDEERKRIAEQPA
ncbi:MAG: hypothetical protein KDK65_04950 [Chlamydiia bacterium]|nr:hypothetical protein [Chlamydiia bacterium]